MFTMMWRAAETGAGVDIKIWGTAEGYSTVTDLAKLRGWSTLQPRMTATS
mgnify:FL=1